MVTKHLSPCQFINKSNGLEFNKTLLGVISCTGRLVSGLKEGLQLENVKFSSYKPI